MQCDNEHELELEQKPVCEITNLRASAQKKNQ